MLTYNNIRMEDLMGEPVTLDEYLELLDEQLEDLRKEWKNAKFKEQRVIIEKEAQEIKRTKEMFNIKD
jgi:hypothetical protein